MFDEVVSSERAEVPVPYEAGEARKSQVKILHKVRWTNAQLKAESEGTAAVTHQVPYPVQKAVTCGSRVPNEPANCGSEAQVKEFQGSCVFFVHRCKQRLRDMMGTCKCQSPRQEGRASGAGAQGCDRS